MQGCNEASLEHFPLQAEQTKLSKPALIGESPALWMHVSKRSWFSEALEYF